MKIKYKHEFLHYTHGLTDENIKKTSANAKKLAKSAILKKKSGIKYRQYSNRSSKPGDPPANQSGALQRSIKNRTILRTRIKRIELSADTPYARRLELGGKGIAERPYLRPALSKALEHYKRDRFPFVIPRIKRRFFTYQ